MSDDAPQKQARYSSWISILLCLVVMMSLTSLTACGKKAGKVDPPPDLTEDNFPYTYPNTAFDPPPTYTPPNAAPQNTVPQNTPPKAP